MRIETVPTNRDAFMTLCRFRDDACGGAQSGCAACRLKSCAFAALAPEERHRHDLHLSRGQRLDSLGGGGCMKFWVITSGTAATCTAFEDGRRQILGLESPGDAVCGLMAGPGTQNWLEALSDCLICEIDLSPRAEQLRADRAFLAASFQIVHRSLERSLHHATTLGRLDSYERVLLFLGEMALRAGRAASAASVVLPMSREDIADYLGLNAETVSRILSKIKKAGLVKFLSPTEYVVPDLGAIERRLPVPLPSVAHACAREAQPALPPQESFA